jgi:hypothetical protein
MIRSINGRMLYTFLRLLQHSIQGDLSGFSICRKLPPPELINNQDLKFHLKTSLDKVILYSGFPLLGLTNIYIAGEGELSK